MGKTLHHKSMGSKGDVAALARKVHQILKNEGTEDKQRHCKISENRLKNP